MSDTAAPQGVTPSAHDLPDVSDLVVGVLGGTGEQQLLVTSSASASARRGFRDRLAKALEGISGSSPSDRW